MAGYDLSGKKIAFLVAHGFEQVELTEPKKAVEEAGAEAHIVSPADGKVKGWEHDHWSDAFDVDVPLSEADADHYDALVLPGGQMNPDNLRADAEAVAFARSFFEAHKPVAAICHGPWLLVEAGVVEGRRMTSYHSIRTDVENAGAEWVDEEVVVDSGLVTSRSPSDLPAFNRKLMEEVHEGRHEKQTV